MKSTIRTFFCVALLFQLFVTPVIAQSHESAVNIPDQERLLQRWNHLKEKARQEVEIAGDLVKPRKVDRGAHPELILRKNEIYLNQKKLSLGESIDKWKRIIPAPARCIEDGMILCLWDDYGLEVGTDDKKPYNVIFMHVHISIDDPDERPGRADYPDGRPAGPQQDSFPHRPFSGYLELNKVGIDAKTEFWEIPAGSIDNRTLTCGLRDCSHPSGPFGEHANITLRLDGRNEHGHLRTLGIGIID